MFPDFVGYLGETKQNISPGLFDKVIPILSDFGGRRLEIMDANGVDFSVLSISGPSVQIEPDTATAVRLARSANDRLAAHVQKRPARYGAFAHLALHHRYAIAKKPSEYLRKNIFIATSGVCSDAALRCALDELGRDNVMFSIDYPFEDTKMACDWIEKARLGDDERTAAAYGNAASLLRLSIQVACTAQFDVANVAFPCSIKRTCKDRGMQRCKIVVPSTVRRPYSGDRRSRHTSGSMRRVHPGLAGSAPWWQNRSSRPP